MRRNIIVVAAAFLSAGMLLVGCGRSEEVPYISSFAPEPYEMSKEDGQSIVQSAEQEELEDIVEPKGETLPHQKYVDFSVIEENHDILEYDICTEPRYDWENTLLGENEELRQDAEEHEEYAKWRHSIGDVHVPLYIDLEYFPFDFNDDGLEDYLVCNSSWEYCGSGGNLVCIYVQEEGGTLKKVFGVTDRLHEGDGIHAQFAVLNEKTDGYYAIVLTSNHILRYDSSTDWYEFHEGE